MNNANNMSKAGFIKSLTHPRKVELAEILLADGFNADEVDVAEFTAKGFDRLTVIELGRQISKQVEGMEGFAIEWPRTDSVEKSRKEEAVDKKNEEETVTDTKTVEVTAEEKAKQEAEATAAAKAAEEAKVAADEAAKKAADEAAAAGNTDGQVNDDTKTVEKTPEELAAEEAAKASDTTVTDRPVG